jgi:excinuclease UvrABC nuclease subunit
MRTILLRGKTLRISASECWYVMNESRDLKTYTASDDQINHDCGVYIFWGWDDKPIRIGKAVKARNRVLMYGKDKRLGGMPEVVDSCQHVSYIRCEDNEESSLLELQLIQEYKPKFNTQCLNK